MKDVLIGAVSVYFVILFIFTIIATPMTIDSRHFLDCHITRRADYVFPVKPIACWLSEEVE